MRNYYSLLLLAPFALPAFAAEPPTAAEVRKVMQYYQDGTDVTLVESKFCSGVEKSGENKNECSAEVPANTIFQGDKSLLWMNFFVPGDEKANVLIQFKYKGKAIKSDEMTLSSAVRYRTWRSLATKKSGSWEVAIEQEMDDGYRTVANLNYTVVEKPE